MVFKFCYLILILTFIVLTKANQKHYIESPKNTDWGVWGNLENCPEDTYVIGMQLKVEREDGWKDDTGLNGVKFFCSKLGESTIIPESFREEDTISSSVGPFGEWKKLFRCNDGDSTLNPKTTAVVGFQLRTEGPKGRLDDTSANNLRIMCFDFSKSHVNQIKIEGDGTSYGDWTEAQVCRAGYAICGIVTQVEQNRGTHDDTSLNNIRAECCKVNLIDDISQEYEHSNSNTFELAKSYRNSIQATRSIPQSTPTSTLPESQKTSSREIPGLKNSLENKKNEKSSTQATLEDIEDPTTNNSDSDSHIEEYLQHELNHELTKLKELSFGPAQITAMVKITSDEDSNTYDHLKDDLNPIVPPEVINTDDKDPDPSHMQFRSGAIEQTMKIVNNSNNLISDSTSHGSKLINNELLLVSSSSSKTTDLKMLFNLLICILMLLFASI